jgi:hypothetical protein
MYLYVFICIYTPLSYEHKPDIPAEKACILEAGTSLYAYNYVFVDTLLKVFCIKETFLLMCTYKCRCLHVFIYVFMRES